MNRLYTTLVALGELSGCHRMPERSFFYKGKQFPVCARCTGAFIGYFVGVIVYITSSVPVWLSIAFCAVMFLDWLLQRINVLASTNIRRLITGMLCGFGLIQLSLKTMVWLINLIA